ncbi:hypothetical protein LR48_Vigan08g115900 [Vigna angularis]|uniref:Pentacotripeptide-repeat region of PRORP domain-containing protein n=1 Tax=Phaseolus angularis TaxID=3914 RepID=A0A0L9V5V5_PHAAN|nr:hypothetical protein LR48_Vigan08g115900 [Vigna angularis]
MAYWVVIAGFRSMRNVAIMFFNFMVEKERFPTILTVNDLCRNLCRHGKVDELLETFHVLNSQNYFKDVEGFNVMISFLCRARKVRESYTVLQEMKKKGFQPNVSSYNYIIEACCKEDLLRPARKLWDEMFSNGCLGNLKTLPIAIIGSGRGISYSTETYSRESCHVQVEGCRLHNLVFDMHNLSNNVVRKGNEDPRRGGNRGGRRQTNGAAGAVLQGVVQLVWSTESSASTAVQGRYRDGGSGTVQQRGLVKRSTKEQWRQRDNVEGDEDERERRMKQKKMEGRRKRVRNEEEK